MTPLLNRLRVFFAALLLGGLLAGHALAGNDAVKEGGIGGAGSIASNSGIGGTGAPAVSGGIGGTGAPASNSGIGGTGAPAMRGGIGGTGDKLSGGIGGTGAVAGKVLFIVGHVEAQNQGQSRLLAREDSIRAGDTLKSGAGATLQLRMADGGTIVLHPESQLVIETFDYHGVEDGQERMALVLQSGRFRAVTGEIGHLHKENYSIRTPNASVGIMGTDHETVFVPVPLPGQAAIAEPGTYNHVFSGATMLQSGNGKLLIQPNQTGFMAVNGSGPTLLKTTPPIFGITKMNIMSDRHANGSTNPVAGAEQDSYESLATEQASKGGAQAVEQNSNDSVQHSDQGPKAPDGGGSTSNKEQQQPSYGTAPNSWQNSDSSRYGAGQTSGDPTQSSQNKVTQTDNLANTTVDLNTLENDGSPASTGSAVVGAHLANGLLAVGTAQSGRAGDQLLVEDDIPGIYSNSKTGFNFISSEDNGPANVGAATVDGVAVTWGIYARGVAFDSSGNPVSINFHPFVYASEGATPPSVISAIGGTATFSNVVGNTPPVTESGNIGGSMSLSVGVNLGNATLTSYNLAVTDASSRGWTGTLNSAAVPLSTFAQGGAALAVTCSGASCGSGVGSGQAAGILIGANAKGLITSYALGTTTGQAVVGTAIMSRP